MESQIQRSKGTQTEHEGRVRYTQARGPRLSLRVESDISKRKLPTRDAFRYFIEWYMVKTDKQKPLLILFTRSSEI